ncbi:MULTISPECIES: ABC transporter ATP-binding protein [unclassified Pseudodesulfovibrio]|uniref:energy-coupling factor ABC transporter ATP-binding protein n=1 Tax=unclassified Pseudodesulfovibrio TaxID=2661612 RepID=UPI000FEC20FC|nr:MULTISPECIES: ABC transporter ATP-binding protein [unclassified Pseudodesulfovibrio]MCJ2163330.1 energy-coupling factor ABC transporter ATP-binding protein [Pseudodesulfovibrio sp. S3-i]RWU06570.1 ABC transporter ATP-binding protein [Pseudodesulfovibrio sp. S3]
MALLEIENLTYSYPATGEPALRDLSLHIEAGEFVAVIGLNNAGKTTLCHALTGVIPHLYNGRMEGRVAIRGVDSRELCVADIALDVGLVMQTPTSQFSGVRFTVFEEVAFGLENRGVAREGMRERVEAALVLAGVADLADRSPLHLSGGQQQKVALASVMACGPSVLVLDEPTTFLDPQGTRQVFETLHDLREDGTTVVIAEHRLEWIARYADRVCLLDGGRLVLDGPPAEILCHPLLPEVGLDWNRFTKVAGFAEAQGMWQCGQPLATTFSQIVNGLKVK